MNIGQYFLDSANASPASPCLSFQERDLTYGEVRAMAQRIRSSLPEQKRIGFLASRSPMAFGSLLGILAAGASYVPLNPSSPGALLERILDLSEVQTLLVGEECAEALGRLLASRTRPLHLLTYGPVEAIRAVAALHPLATLEEIDPDSQVDPSLPASEPRDGICYVLFTSGSTGIPKGVMVRHENVRSYIEGFLERHPLRSADRHSQIADLTFDLSVHDLFAAWKVGASLVVFPASALLAPVQYAKDKAITAWVSGPSVPALMEMFKQDLSVTLPTVRLSMFCGEKFTWNALQVWKRIAPNSLNLNYYGPTEATVAMAGYVIPDDFDPGDCFQGGIPIGEPFPRQAVEIRRPDGSLCEPLEQGALWLGGDQVTEGYLDPIRTAESFVPKNGEVWYRSGDVCFKTPGGLLQFVGREDFQVKIMGVRVELGEIEGLLLKETGASFVVADVARVRGDLEELFCVLPAAFEPHKRRLRDALKRDLEAFMVPRVWKFVEEPPRTPNGKVDRKALRSLVAASIGQD